MARTDGPSFAERVAQAGITPQQRERAWATLLLAELVDELCGLIREQTDQITEQHVLLGDIRDGTRHQATNNITHGGTTEGKEGGGDVQLREPAVPPPDPDDEPGNTTEPEHSGRAAAGSAARRPAVKKATGKTARRGTSKPGGEG